MPTELHNSHQRWAMSAAMVWGINGLLNAQEARLLCPGVGTCIFYSQPIEFRMLIIS